MLHRLLSRTRKSPLAKSGTPTLCRRPRLTQRRTNNPAINVGLLLGPVSGLIDVECDGDEATAAYAKLLGHAFHPNLAIGPWQASPLPV